MNTGHNAGDMQHSIECIECSLDESLYGVPIEYVNEIIVCNNSIVPFPDAVPSVEGVINVRGRIVPIVDLSFHLSEKKTGILKRERIIIVRYDSLFVGFAVDSVSRIQRIVTGDIDMTYEDINSKHGYAYGVARIGEKIIFLLDFMKIIEAIGVKEIKNIKEVSTNEVDD